MEYSQKLSPEVTAQSKQIVCLFTLPKTNPVGSQLPNINRVNFPSGVRKNSRTKFFQIPWKQKQQVFGVLANAGKLDFLTQAANWTPLLLSQSPLWSDKIGNCPFRIYFFPTSRLGFWLFIFALFSLILKKSSIPLSIRLVRFICSWFFFSFLLFSRLIMTDV